MLIQINDTRPTVTQSLTKALDHIDAGRKTKVFEAPHPAYRQAQEAAPAGARLLVMLERPYLLDFARNPIWQVDFPGTVSPPPGMPFSKDGEALAAYLGGVGVRYFAVNDPDHSEDELYGRSHWLQLKRDRNPLTANVAPRFLGFFDEVSQLLRTRKHLFDDGHLITLDLESPR
jgi:hypothetical protein